MKRRLTKPYDKAKVGYKYDISFPVISSEGEVDNIQEIRQTNLLREFPDSLYEEMRELSPRIPHKEDIVQHRIFSYYSHNMHSDRLHMTPSHNDSQQKLMATYQM